MIFVVEEIMNRLFNNEFKMVESKNDITSFTVKQYVKSKRRRVDITREYAHCLEESYVNSAKKHFPDVEIRTELSLYDKAVFDAVVTLFESGTYEFTIEQVYRKLTGDETAQLSNSKSGVYKKIRDSLLNMYCHHLRLRFSEETDNYGTVIYRDNEAFNGFYSPILNLKRTCRNSDRRMAEGWRIQPGFVIKYIKAKGQVDSVNSKHYRIPLSATENTIILRTFLLGRILFIKGKTRKNGVPKTHFENISTIPFTTIYEAMGIPVAHSFGKTYSSERERRQQIDVINKTKKIFDFWQNETKLLKSWEIVENDNGKKAFKISVNVSAVH